MASFQGSICSTQQDRQCAEVQLLSSHCDDVSILFLQGIVQGVLPIAVTETRPRPPLEQHHDKVGVIPHCCQVQTASAPLISHKQLAAILIQVLQQYFVTL